MSLPQVGARGEEALMDAIYEGVRAAVEENKGMRVVFEVTGKDGSAHLVELIVHPHIPTAEEKGVLQ